jgi:hypothetical protein
LVAIFDWLQSSIGCNLRLVAIFDWLQSSIATLHNFVVLATLHNFVVLATPSLLRWQGVDNNVVHRGNPAQLCCSKGAAALAIVFTFSKLLLPKS